MGSPPSPMGLRYLNSARISAVVCRGAFGSFPSVGAGALSEKFENPPDFKVRLTTLDL